MSKKILLVDDDDLILKSVEGVLKKCGYQVVLASDGFEAIEKVRIYNFNLIICDMRMPGMNGIETIQRIRQELSMAGKEKTAEIFLTGYAENNLEKQAKAMKVNKYLYKPFDLQEFISEIQRVLANE